MPGLYVFRVRSVTTGGIPDPSPAIHAWRMRPPNETEAPDTTITASPPLSTTSRSATFRFTASELGITFECALDAAAFSECNSGIVLTNLSVGEHTFQVRATDAFGNVDLEPASYTWLVVGGDGTPPVAIITNAPPNNGHRSRTTSPSSSSRPTSRRRSSARSTALRTRAARRPSST